MKNLFIVFALIMTSACAFKDTDSINKQEVQDNYKLEKIYSDIRGNYEGKISNASGIQEISLQIYTLSIKDGTNSDGTNRFRLVPKAYLKKVNPVGNSQLLDVRFIPESGKITLTDANAEKQLGIDEIHTINATVTGQIIKGEALKPTGPMGEVFLSLVSRESSGPENGSTKEEYANNLSREYQKIVGEYSGEVVDSRVDAGRSYKILVRLFIVKEVINGNILPILKGFYTRADDDSAIFDLSLNVAYDHTVTPATIAMSGKSEGRYYISMDGHLINGKIKANLSTHRGLAGPIELTKIK